MAAQVHLGAARGEPAEVVVHVVGLVAAFLARGDRVGVGGLGLRLALRRGLLRATRGRAGLDERRFAQVHLLGDVGEEGVGGNPSLPARAVRAGMHPYVHFTS